MVCFKRIRYFLFSQIRVVPCVLIEYNAKIWYYRCCRWVKTIYDTELRVNYFFDVDSINHSTQQQVSEVVTLIIS